MSKRILINTTHLGTGGVQTFILNHLPYLIRDGFEVTFILQHFNQQVENDLVKKYNCSIHHITSLSNSIFRYMYELSKLLKSEPRFDIIHAHMNFMSVFPLLIAYLYKIPVRISHSHSNYKPSSRFSALLRVPIRWLLNFLATDYWACSEEALVWLYRKNKESANCKVIKNSINLEKYKFSVQTREKIRNELKIGNCNTWIHIGTFSYAKNHKFLLELFNEFKKQNINSKLLLCGDGNYKSEIENLINYYELQNDVLMLGNVNNCEDYLSASDFFVFPSIIEGMPFSVVEAQASGISCVIANTISSKSVFNQNVSIIKDFEITSWLNALNSSKLIYSRSIDEANFIKSGMSLNMESSKLINYYYDLIKRK